MRYIRVTVDEVEHVLKEHGIPKEKVSQYIALAKKFNIDPSDLKSSCDDQTKHRTA